MSLHILKTTTILPISIEHAWDFFSSPVNLSVITPPEMRFKILSSFKAGDKIFAGMLIDYTVRPLFGVPLHWTTMITEADAPNFFSDEQIKGPYAYWRHEHYFRQVSEGVEMNDVVNWRVPLGLLGDLVNALIVEKKVKAIFDFRKEKLRSLFAKKLKGDFKKL